MTSAMTSHFGPVNVDFLTSGRTNLIKGAMSAGEHAL